MRVFKYDVIRALLSAKRPDLANVVSRYTTAAVSFEQRGDQYVIWAPSYNAIKNALPAIKKAGFRYNSVDKTWVMPVNKFTPHKRKALEPYVTFDEKAAESEIRKMLDQLKNIKFFSVTYQPLGFALSGDVWSFKETVKTAGGQWDTARKQYVFRFATVDKKSLQDVIERVQKREKQLAENQRSVDKLIPDLLKKPWSILKCTMSGSTLSIWSSNQKYRGVIKDHFPSAKWSGTNWVVEISQIDPKQIPRFISAVDDLQKTSNTQPTPVPKTRTVPKVSGADFVFSVGEGYGGQYLPPGTVLKSNENQLKRGWPPYITVVKTTKYYVREDGMTFGVGDESGDIFTYHCRESTAKESIEEMDRNDRNNLKKSAKKRLFKISIQIQQRGTYPKPWVVPDGTRYDVEPITLYGGGYWFIISGPRVWYIQNNGADGDNWSHNNVRTGGAGAIGWYVDDDSLRKEVESLLNILGVPPMN